MCNSRLEKAIRLAIKQANKGNSPNFRLGAVLIRGSKILSIGRNYFYKTHPKAKNTLRTIHAEVDCIRKANNKKIVNSSLVIVRVTNSGLLSMAKPCEYCHELLYQVGVKDVYFTDYDGQISHIYL